jgi:PKD repeat protein
MQIISLGQNRGRREMNVRGKNKWAIIALVAVLLLIAWVIPVSAIPNADFIGTPLTGPKPLNVQFTDASTGNGTLTYAWNFGDGNTSILKDPSHTYYTVGSYTVNLTVTDVDGPDNSSTKTQPGYITVNEAPPVAAFSGTPTSGPKPLNVQFTDASTGVIATYSWNFGDGNTSILKDPSHTYYTVGSYTVNLTVTGPGGSDFENKINYITITNATTNRGI